ncbi:MAG TPA: IS1595 family transposase, partial [Bacteroidia bacterium]|nr:IS1595 family transposase [Bacteroidia bacterium]
MNFKSLPQLLDFFKEEKTCIKYYEQLRWNGKPVCPHCDSEKPYKTNRGYKCSNAECHKKFTVKVGTIFENSKISFRTWFAAIYLCTSSKKGISSVLLAEQLDITQKTAWFVLHRVREMLKNQAPEMLGENNMVEADETYIGGKEKNRHTKKRQSAENPELANDGTIYNKKKMVVGIIERGGKVVLKFVPNATAENMVPFIQNHVPSGAHIVTDEHTSYSQLNKIYTHNTVTHSLRVYVQGNTHTNTIENFWSILKRGLYGIYHQVSDKHLERYLNEFA